MSALGRRRWVWIPLFLLIWVGSVVFARILPSIYLSQSTILVELQELPQDLVTATIGGYAETRLSALDQRIRSASSLLNVIRKHNVYPELERAGLEADMLEMMNAALIRESSVVMVLGPSGRPTETTVSFSVTFEHESPVIAQKVTNEFAEMYLQENTRSRVAQASEVSRFLRNEVDRLGVEFNDIEGRITQFKEQHINELPEQIEMSRRQIESTESNLLRSEQRVQALQDTKRELETRVRLESANRITVGELLDMRRSELAQAESRYSPLHPDVKRLKAEVAELETQMDHPEKVFVIGEDGDKPPNNRVNIALQAQLSEVTTNLQVEVAAMNELKRKIATYEERLIGAPEVEQQYQQLTLERENVFNALRDIKQKLRDAELGEQMERESKAERFSIIQPATLPTEPVRPNRFAIGVLGLVLAIGVSIGVVTLLESMDTAIRGERALEQIIHAPPIASIPIIR